LPFHRGDVFVNGRRTGIEEYSPDGTPVQLIEGSAGGFGFCFDPSGNYLIAPGAGLFDKQGRSLESNWASDKAGGACVVDALGDVLVPTDPSTVRRYDIDGNLLQSFNVPVGGFGLAIALGPDGCTLYYGSWLGYGSIGRFNVCTNTQESGFVRDPWVDELRVLPNWEVLRTSDSGAALYGTSGQFVRGYGLPYQDDFRTMALDSDGTSFWMCCTEPEFPWRKVGHLLRFDINTRDLLADWEPMERGSIAVYSPDNNGRGAG
jgi:hypothetical protein